MIRILYLLLVSALILFQIEYINKGNEVEVSNTEVPVISVVVQPIPEVKPDITDLVLNCDKLTVQQSKQVLTRNQAADIVTGLYIEKFGTDLMQADEQLNDEVISRREFAHLFAPLLSDEPKINDCTYITDVHKGDEYYDDILLLYETGIMTGSHTYGSFDGDGFMTAGIARTMISRLWDTSLRVGYNPFHVTSKTAHDVEAVLQNPELPTGCEVTSLAILLRYLGFDADKLDLADNYLEKGEIGVTNPHSAFVGTPYKYYSFGCFAPVIVSCANKYMLINNSNFRAIDMTGASLEQLFIEIENGNPVIVWATMYMKDCEWVDRWEIDGEIIQFPLNEHCMVLHGFDIEQNVVYIADPLVGNVEYDLDLFLEKYQDLLCQAVVIK